MNPLSMFGSILPNRNAPRRLPRKQAARVERKKAPHRRFLWLEQLENRVTPSLLSTFELDANVRYSGSGTATYDWANTGPNGSARAGRTSSRSRSSAS